MVLGSFFGNSLDTSHPDFQSSTLLSHGAGAGGDEKGWNGDIPLSVGGSSVSAIAAHPAPPRVPPPLHPHQGVPSQALSWAL